MPNRGTVELSIILPFYNSARWLPSCLKQLCKQRLSSLEILAIDDGSTDDSAKIAEDFAKKDPRIRLLGIEHAGPGIARNIGLENARGKYIGFVDSDDLAEVSMFETMVATASSANADAVVCDYFLLRPMPFGKVYTQRANSTHLVGQNGHIAYPAESRFNPFTLNPAPWNKIFHRDLLERIGFRFSEERHYEEVPFVYTCLMRARRVCLIDQPLYHHRYRWPGSVSAAKDERRFDIFAVLAQLENTVRSTPEISHQLDNFLAFRTNTLLYHLSLVHSSMRDAFWQHIQKTLHGGFDRQQSANLSCPQTLVLRIRMINAIGQTLLFLAGKRAAALMRAHRALLSWFTAPSQTDVSKKSG